MRSPEGVFPDWGFLLREVGNAIRAFFLPLRGLRDALAEFRVALMPSSLYLDEPVSAITEALLPSQGREGEPLRLSGAGGKIEFRNVTFRYPSGGRPVFSGLSFTINSGEHVAILGRVGGGKSTIARLILGDVTPDDGSVLINGTDIREIDPASLRATIGVTMQESELLPGSIRENIALGRQGIDDDEIVRAAQISGTHQFVFPLANGYDFRLAERGEGLSAGQKQSIMIARALAGRPPILIMDEPSIGMDNQTEGSLIKRLREELADRTLLLITHRPPLVQLTDRLIVINEGEIVLDGPRDSLLPRLLRRAA